ncbi:MAG TPA: biotin/lipoate A/B protein ligase family protein [Ignavibacteriaceae bacterium]|nr:biotin/lipoate A/B protein ligase family protein [Ignavibacteriaceae bacterium]
MNWQFLNSGVNSGKFNMDFDTFLAENFEPNTAVLRLYRWNPYCISLGANQSLEDINLAKTRYHQIDVVKRPTGGRAILHSQEITYSVIYPIDAAASAKNIYYEINLALRKGLINFDSGLNSIDLEHSQPNFKEFYKSEISSICFAVSAKSELNLNGKKIVGSAQRKLGNVILQHGSILCGQYHKKIVDYLNVEDEKRNEMLQEISSTTIDLKSALNIEIDYAKLNSSILNGFKEHFNSDFEEIDHEYLKNKMTA